MSCRMMWPARFAQRVSLIKNRATINEGMDPELVIKRLKNEVLTLREEIAFLKGESGEGDVLNPQEVRMHYLCMHADRQSVRPVTSA